MARITRCFTLLALLAVATAASAQDEPPAQAVSPSVLLPVFAVDVRIDPAAVDGSAYPSTSAAHPHSGTSAVFQRVWESLRPAGFNAIRFPVDLSQGQGAVHRVANLCAWADREGVSLLPVLVSTETAPFGEDYAAATAAFVGKLVATLGAPGPESLATYPRILMFQLGEEVDHPARNGRMRPDVAAQRALAAASGLRAAEQTALEGTGLYLTPLVAMASLDAELVTAGAPAGAELEEAAFAEAYAGLRQALAPLAASPDVETVGVSWYPGSVGAGGVERLGPLVQALAADFAGKQLLVVTGASTAFQPAEEQGRFASLAFTNLADARARAGGASPLLGVVFHKGLGMVGPGSPPPPGFEQARRGWQPPTMAKDLLALWRGEKASPAIARWDAEVESRMGLLAVGGGEGASATLTPQPALEALETIAGIVGSAPSEATGGEVASAEPGSAEPAESAGEGGERRPGMLEEKLTTFAGSLLDQVLAHLGAELSEAIGGNGAPASGEYPDDGGGGATEPGEQEPAPAQVSIQSAHCAPAGPKVGDPVSCQVALRNESDGAAAGLTVALLDDADYLLGDETMVEGVSVAAGAATNLAVPWTPAVTGVQSVRAKVYDAYGEIAAAAAGQIDVQPAQGKPPGNVQPGSNAPGSIQPGQVKPGTAVAVAPSRFTDLLEGKGSSTALKPARPGFPLIGPMTTRSSTSDVSLPVANSSSRSITGLTATLQVDGKAAQQIAVGALVPGQSRTLVFRRPKTAPGSHELRVVLVRPGATALVAGVLRLDAGKTTRQVRTVPGTSPDSRVAPRTEATVRPPLDAARAASTPGAIAPTAATRGAVVLTPRRKTTPATRAQTAGGQVTRAEGTATSGTRGGRTTTTSRGTATTRATGPTVRSSPPPGRPDLAVAQGGLHVSPLTAAPGRPVAVQVVVVNVGGSESTGAVVSFQVRGSRGEVAARGGQRLGAVPARGRATASWSFTMPAAGSWRVEVVVRAAGDADAGNDASAATVTSTANRARVRARPAGR